MGIRVYEGHRAENIDDADLVVTTSAAAADNPEIQEAHRRSIPVLKRAEMVAHLMQGRTSIAVAGTHGKTTTTALITYMLVRAGLSPTFLVGGEMRDLETNAEAGGGRHIVVEADEFDRAFLHYTPDLAVVTNIEPDHLDIYGTFDALVEGLRRYGHRRALPLDNPAALPKLIHDEARSGDLVVCLGAGDITTWAYALPGQLEALAKG
jgi:UDP-N-acetylmuramate--alanine ligase